MLFFDGSFPAIFSLSEIDLTLTAECDVPFPGIPVPGNSSFFLWYRNRNRKNLVPKKILEPESKIFGTEKKSQNRSRKILVPKKNIGTSLEIPQNISVDLGPGLVPFPGFLQFFYGIGTGLEKNVVPKEG